MRLPLLLMLSILALSGCRDRIICPAFQSTYILDDSVRMTYYSYLWKIDKEERLKYLAEQRARTNVGDSSMTASLTATNQVDYYAYVEPYVVPEREVNKNKFGIVKYEPYWMKVYQLRTAPMENVLSPPMPVDTSSVDQGEFVAADFSDDTLSLSIDSTVVALEEDPLDSLDEFELPLLAQAPPPKPKQEIVYLYGYDPNDKMLNVEQQYYNKHFGHLLYVKRDPVPQAAPVLDTPADSTSASGGLKGMFGKKRTKPTQEPDPIDEEEPIDEEIEEPGGGE